MHSHNLRKTKNIGPLCCRSTKHGFGVATSAIGEHGRMPMAIWRNVSTTVRFAGVRP
jgi:hypothetical protein